MQEPYLLLGLKMAPTAPNQDLSQVIAAVEGALPPTAIMELKIPDVFGVQLTPPDDFSVFKKVVKVLKAKDTELNGDLQWFVQLVAGAGALACN